MVHYLPPKQSNCALDYTPSIVEMDVTDFPENFEIDDANTRQLKHNYIFDKVD